MKRLTRINDYLAKQPPAIPEETEVVLNGPDTMRNILINETVKLSKLEQVSNELIADITDPNVRRLMNQKEKQNLLRLVQEVEKDSRDFIFKVAEMSTKNSFLNEVLKIAQNPTEVVISEDGTVYKSSITEEQRNDLTILLRDILNEQTRL